MRFLVIAFGYIIVELGKGLVISVVSRTQHQAFLLVMLIGMLDVMFTGYAAPVESMPPVMQFIANFMVKGSHSALLIHYYPPFELFLKVESPGRGKPG